MTPSGFRWSYRLELPFIWSRGKNDYICSRKEDVLFGIMLERETFDKFCAAKYPGLVAYAQLCLRDAGPIWAEDVVQDVLYSVWKNRFFIRWDSTNGGKIHAYCLRSVFNRCMDYMERRKTRNAFETEEKIFLEQAEKYYDPDRNPVIRHLFDQDLRATLEQSIENLTDKSREVFRLSYMEGLTHAEIAEKLGISVRTVDGHIYTALKSLRSSLSGV